MMDPGRSGARAPRPLQKPSWTPRPMPHDEPVAPPRPALQPATRLTQVGRTSARGHGFVNAPLVRGSTVLHPDLAHMKGREAQRYDQAMVYGTHGTPTHFA